MNSVLQIKGQFEQKSNTSAFGPKNLPANESVKVPHLTNLKNQLEQILAFWKKETIINGALVSVHYTSVVAKSNRIEALLAYKKIKPNDTIKGSKFEGEDSQKHVFTHYVSLETLEESIRRLDVCIRILNHRYNGIISYDDINLLNTKQAKFDNSELSLSGFVQVIVDSFYVARFDIDRASGEIDNYSIVTIYKTGVKTSELMGRLGIDMIDAKMVDETTMRLSPNELKLLQSKAPYLIAMQVRDLSEITLEHMNKCDNQMGDIPDPSNEPTIGVIDTLFNDNVYFSDWVEFTNMLDPELPIESEDDFHGTAVSSLIVDGPTINPQLDDGCGRFKVKHFGVAKKGKFSAFSILRSIRHAVSENPDIKVWNLSLGSAMQIDPNFISPEAAELDRIQCEYDVVFIVAGTNKPNDVKGNMRIGAPADSLNSLVVNSVDAHNRAASYHRVGPVLSFFHKPDLSCFGGDGKDKIRVCTSTGEYFVSGTSFAAPWITRKMAYLIYNMGLSREVAKALLIDSAAGWNRKDDMSHSVGYGIVPKRIEEIIQSPNDEIRFIMTGASESYETYIYNIPVPTSLDKHPFFARATLCYFPNCSRNQGVDYTNTEMDIHFGRVAENKSGKAQIKSINNNRQGDDGFNMLHEIAARRLYRKWDNIKHISDEIKKGSKPRKKYGNGNWGLSIKTKERLQTTRDRSTPFGVVVTLKEMNGVNRIDDFIKLCMVRGLIVNRIDIENRVDVYNKAEEEIKFE